MLCVVLTVAKQILLGVMVIGFGTLSEWQWSDNNMAVELQR